VAQAMRDHLAAHKAYIAMHGQDLPEILNWRWGGQTDASGGRADTAADF
jgi:xylulose-5-phosphate/fructose-6-phosphate phosphoketolase